MPDVAAPLRALLVGDDEQMRDTFSVVVTEYGFGEVTIADSGAEALSVVAGTDPHVMIVDLAVTGQLGLRTLGILRRLATRCAIVVMAPFPALQDRALAAGADGFLDPSDLRPLGPWLDLIRNAAHSGSSCSCCAFSTTAPGTAAAFDPGSSSITTELSPPLTSDESTKGEPARDQEPDEDQT